jgi:sugar O-acyltransferase (sialic acid O-acetyltransferase NeuD family)
MIIIGAKGFAKELLQVYLQIDNSNVESLAFFDNISIDNPSMLYNKFPVIKNEREVTQHFAKFGNQFSLGLGNPSLRKMMCELFESWGGQLTSIISPDARIGQFDVEIGTGATILANVSISNSVKIGKGLLMYSNAIITHDCIAGDFLELSPGATILGNCLIGDEVHIGANATVLPGKKLGDKIIVGAGSVVTKNFPNQKILKGIPAK